MMNIFNRAVNPNQYDLDDVNWDKEGLRLDSPTRKFMWFYFEPYVKDWKGKSLFDIGSGTGWFMNQVLKQGLSKVYGIEPSKKNVQMARKYYPKTETEEVSLENFESTYMFDIIVGIMSFLHIKNLNEAFSKVVKLLKKNGRLFLVIPDFEHFKKPRYNYEIIVEPINRDSYAVQVKRPSGTLASIVRKTDVYRRCGNRYGLFLKKDIPMLPTEELIVEEPKYQKMENEALTRLLVFEKVNACGN